MQVAKSMADERIRRTIPGRRKKAAEKKNKAVWVYFDEDEKSLVDEAAAIDGRSNSSFVAEAALDKAMEVIRLYNKTVDAASLRTRELLNRTSVRRKK
jgi:uncharacterized protein (DUF1778 family)